MNKTTASILLLSIVVILIRVIGAYFLPVTTDEAYYFLWSKFPDLGYFDHPPAVAWLASTSLIGTSVFWARLGTVLVSLLTIPFFISLFNMAGIKGTGATIAAFLLTQLSAAGLIFGFLTTPDVVLNVAWIIAIHEAAKALTVNPKRWVTAGIATGLGLLSKYVMIVIIPVFLWSLIKSKPSKLFNKWPYLGALTALLVFSPNIIWNAQNDWTTFRFQLKHGLADSHEISTKKDEVKLPEASDAKVGSLEYELGHFFDPPKEIKKIKRKKSQLELLWRRVSDFVGGQLALWGGIALLLLYNFKSILAQFKPKQPDHELGPLLRGGALFPLIFFGTLSLFTKIEANWPAVYLGCAGVLIAPIFSNKLRSLSVACTLNVLVILLLIYHAAVPTLVTKKKPDRILKETHGYAELVKFLGDQESIPLLFDTYQLGSMIKFYSPKVKLSQWPGITRDSEFTRRPELQEITHDDISASKDFWLISQRQIPPHLPGFIISSLREVRSCLNQGIVVTESNSSPEFINPCNDSTTHIWYLSRYTKE